MEFREFSAKTVDEAITKASLEFEVSSENLEIQIVSEGKTGFLGSVQSLQLLKRAKKATASEKILLPKEQKRYAEKVRAQRGKKPVKEAAPESVKEIDRAATLKKRESYCKKRRRNCKYEG